MVSVGPRICSRSFNCRSPPCRRVVAVLIYRQNCCGGYAALFLNLIVRQCLRLPVANDSPLSLKLYSVVGSGFSSSYPHRFYHSSTQALHSRLAVWYPSWCSPRYSAGDMDQDAGCISFTTPRLSLSTIQSPSSSFFAMKNTLAGCHVHRCCHGGCDPAGRIFIPSAALGSEPPRF